MGNNQFTNSAQVQQDFTANMLNDNQQNCKSSSVQLAAGNIITVDGSNITGNFTGIEQGTQTDASCVMTSSMESTVSNLFTSMLNQKFDINSGITSAIQARYDVTNETQVIQDAIINITNISNEVCDAQSMQSATNNFIYLSDTTVGGNAIGISQQSNPSATCSMQNISKIAAYNKSQQQTDQGTKFIGGLGPVIGAIILIVVVIGIIAIIGGLYAAHKAKEAKAQATTSTTTATSTAPKTSVTTPKIVTSTPPPIPPKPVVASTS